MFPTLCDKGSLQHQQRPLKRRVCRSALLLASRAGCETVSTAGGKSKSVRADLLAFFPSVTLSQFGFGPLSLSETFELSGSGSPSYITGFQAGVPRIRHCNRTCRLTIRSGRERRYSDNSLSFNPLQTSGRSRLLQLRERLYSE
jgi:hypothetical protein